MGRGRGTSTRTAGTIDPYAVLGVGRDADATTVKRAFRRVARTEHPDVNPGDPTAEERFKRASNAYEILSDPSRRAAYDRGASTPRPRAQQGSTSTPPASRENIAQQMRDMVADLTGITAEDARADRARYETDDSVSRIARDLVDGLGDRLGRVRASPGTTDVLEDARSAMARIREDARRRATRFGL